MIADVTDTAVTQLLLLAAEVNISEDQVVFLIEGKFRNPAVMVWFITPAAEYDAKRYTPVTVKGLRFACENHGAIFLTRVSIDYDADLLKNNKVYAPTSTSLNKPVWPKGFIFDNQILQDSFT